MMTALRKYHEYWWTCFPAVPARREDFRYQRIMRLYADHTLNGLNGQTGRSVYKEGGEDHLVLSFFENFVVDQRHEWIGRIAQRLGLLQGKILAANWSYAFEERLSGEARPRIADLVLHWRDNSGNAVVVIEAKRPGGMPRSGLNEKDDPRSDYYMKYSAMREIPRKQQMLLISAKDKEKLSGELRSDARVLTWE